MRIILYTSKCINLISFIISIIIYLCMTFFVNKVVFTSQTIVFKANFVSQENLTENKSIYSNQLKENEEEQEEIAQDVAKDNWYIQIDKISLKAPIQEGTTQKIMEEYVGHFEESSKDIGNICLAAHNRGYKNNYFSRIKELQKGDEIIYRYKNIERIYIVTKHEIIENTDWRNLENTEDNRITLITCVENEPEYRRCIQGIEK